MIDMIEMDELETRICCQVVSGCQGTCSRRAAHGSSRGGLPGAPVPHLVAHPRASARTSTREPAVVHPVVGWGQLETQRHGLTFLRFSLRVVNGRVIEDMMAKYLPDIEHDYDGIGM
jgi:hypothetical protein